MITRARAKALASEARQNCFVVTEELGDPSIPKLVLRIRRSFGIANVGEEMASKNQQLMADRLVKRNACNILKIRNLKEGRNDFARGRCCKVSIKEEANCLLFDLHLQGMVGEKVLLAKNAGETSGKDSENVEEPKVKRAWVDTILKGKSSPLKIKASSSTIASSDDKGKGKKMTGVGLPTSEISEEESEEEMTTYLNAMSEQCMGGAMLAQYFVGAVRDLAALPRLKKSFHKVTAKLEADELKLQTALGQVKLVIEERDKLSTSVSDLTLQNKTLTDEKQKPLMTPRRLLMNWNFSRQKSKSSRKRMNKAKRRLRILGSSGRN
ncbi:DNA-polymerase I [Sesbania bispinosa]|nr:DNA-polymerase I [Sesbania bispinosa]